MELKEYAELVERVRNLQAQYFKTRSSTYLDASKKLEITLDQETEKILGPDRIKNQQSLF